MWSATTRQTHRQWKHANKEFRGTADWTDVDINSVEVTKEELLKESHLTKVHIDTVYRWMRLLGFKYETRKKHFYVDTHNKPEVAKDRDERFSPEYLQRELRMYRWVQLPLAKAKTMIAEGKLHKS